MICAVCAATVEVARTGWWVHTSLPDERSDPDHEIVPVLSDVHAGTQSRFQRLTDAASDLAEHHATYHPRSECEFLRLVTEAMKS
jgi:hypothetical protein